jgi:hypothetical protein
VLGLILTLAINGGSVLQGGLLLSAYSVGLAIPFLLAATQISWVTFLLQRYGKLSLIVEKIMGVVMIAIGALLLSGRLSTLGNLGAFFDFLNEERVGLLLLALAIASLLPGLLGGWWAKRRGRVFVDGMLLGAGLTFFVSLLVLYGAGVFTFLR